MPSTEFFVCKQGSCIICLMGFRGFFVWLFVFVISRGGKHTENINGTLPSYQPVQEEEPQKKQPGKTKFMVSLLVNKTVFEGH